MKPVSIFPCLICWYSYKYLSSHFGETINTVELLILLKWKDATIPKLKWILFITDVYQRLESLQRSRSHVIYPPAFALASPRSPPDTGLLLLIGSLFCWVPCHWICLPSVVRSMSIFWESHWFTGCLSSQFAGFDRKTYLMNFIWSSWEFL